MVKYNNVTNEIFNYNNFISNFISEMYKIQDKYNFDYVEFSNSDENNNIYITFTYKSSKKYIKVVSLYNENKFNYITNTSDDIKTICMENDLIKLKSNIDKDMREYKENKKYYLI